MLISIKPANYTKRDEKAVKPHGKRQCDSDPSKVQCPVHRVPSNCTLQSSPGHIGGQPLFVFPYSLGSLRCCSSFHTPGAPELWSNNCRHSARFSSGPRTRNSPP